MNYLIQVLLFVNSRFALHLPLSMSDKCIFPQQPPVACDRCRCCLLGGATRLECGHRFCLSCLAVATESDRKCTICTKHITDSDILIAACDNCKFSNLLVDMFCGKHAMCGTCTDGGRTRCCICHPKTMPESCQTHIATPAPQLSLDGKSEIGINRDRCSDCGIGSVGGFIMLRCTHRVCIKCWQRFLDGNFRCKCCDKHFDTPEFQDCSVCGCRSISFTMACGRHMCCCRCCKYGSSPCQLCNIH
jgi:hypothetical protein